MFIVIFTIENLLIHQNNTTIVDDLAYSNYFEYLCPLISILKQEITSRLLVLIDQDEFAMAI